MEATSSGEAGTAGVAYATRPEGNTTPRTTVALEADVLGHIFVGGFDT